MPNHYHLLIEITDKSLSSGMRLLNGMYSQRFNRNHKRVGHLFQGRFKSIVVDKESYLLELSRYIVLNPVRAGIASRPQDWKWSSYGATMGKAPRPAFLCCRSILSLFSSDPRRARQQYADFVAAGLEMQSPWSRLKGGIYLGDDQFVKEVGELIGEKRQDKEIIRGERFCDRPALETLLPPDVPRPIDSNTVKAVCAARDMHGYSLKEIADFFGVHNSTLTKAIRRTRCAEDTPDPTLMT
jgi:hypothetical protein